ncbi:hypothetical protein, partial [Clostridium sp.]|uniref:hypothetical protein n=1 Tax=Clostridium sp. TaxID=1506 RepID=UPI002A600C48|nr:hypothetical protein [Clostridium sp.]
ESSLMLAFPRDANTSQSMIDIFNMFEKDLGEELFRKLFLQITAASFPTQKQSSTVLGHGLV